MELPGLGILIGGEVGPPLKVNISQFNFDFLSVYNIDAVN